MLHKIKEKSIISLGSPRPSPIVLSYCFIENVLPNPRPPLYFILVEIHNLLIGMWYIPSTAEPAAVPTSFVFLSACSAESYAAAPATMSLG